MDKYYSGYPEIDLCYKVNFNFPMVNESNRKSISDNRVEKWHKELEKTFTKMFKDNSKKHTFSCLSSGEIKFENSKVDYIKNQGYRFIVQFYPNEFIQERRVKSLNILDI